MDTGALPRARGRERPPRRRRRRDRDRRRGHRRRRVVARSRRGAACRSASSSTAGSRSSTPQTRPNVFRIAPTDHGIAFRLAEYLIPKHLKVALLHDDSDYGAAGAKELKRAFAGEPLVGRDRRDASRRRARPRRRRSCARGARTRRRCSSGAARRRSPPRSPRRARPAGTCPFYTPPTGADPFVRQQLADHPSLGRRPHVRRRPADRRGRRRAVPGFEQKLRQRRTASTASACKTRRRRR